ncbi:MAG: chitinase [Acidimicrobiales bacterium]
MRRIRENRRRLSVTRLAAVTVVVGAVGVSGCRWINTSLENDRDIGAAVEFAPYVDATLTPLLHFEDPLEQPSREVILGFVVSDLADPCRPSWGTFYDLDAAGRALDLDRRIVRFREAGGDVAVSFGGALNQELAVGCTDPRELVEAYGSVIDRYDLDVVDFDIEGPALLDEEAHLRRAEAIAALQAEYPDLEVWFTVPIAPSGLTDETVTLLDIVFEAGVDVAGVNAMTMNYGQLAENGSWIDTTVGALTAMWVQLDGIHARAGIPITDAQLWSMIGATPMIGQNDVPTEVVTTDDARSLKRFAQEVGLGRLSMWSANRDRPCGVSASDGRVSNTCSGVEQEVDEFAMILSASTPVERDDRADDRRDDEPRSSRVAIDDPRTSPYPLWREARAYVEGDKVVWQGRVYEAKWYSEGEAPDAPVRQVWETPWRYLGPVLEIDRVAVAEERMAAGDRTRWSGERVYIAGDEVIHGTYVFQARWWTQGDTPEPDPDQPFDHPWMVIGELGPGDLDGDGEPDEPVGEPDEPVRAPGEFVLDLGDPGDGAPAGAGS